MLNKLMFALNRMFTTTSFKKRQVTVSHDLHYFRLKTVSKSDYGTEKMFVFVFSRTIFAQTSQVRTVRK